MLQDTCGFQDDEGGIEEDGNQDRICGGHPGDEDGGSQDDSEVEEGEGAGDPSGLVDGEGEVQGIDEKLEIDQRAQIFYFFQPAISPRIFTASLTDTPRWTRAERDLTIFAGFSC